MATYIPGITDAPSQRLSFKPDWNRVERGLMLRSNAYVEGARKVKSLYDSLFQSTMLRDDNIERRDAYLKDISEGLKTISALDLSIPQNQENALKLFEPLNGDQMIVKDIMFTKSFLSESQKAEQMRTSTNPEVRKQYWSTGMKALQYRAEEFKNADANAAMSMSAPKYVPNVDIVGLANKMFKDAGISVKQDVINGGYIWTKKNGDIAYPLTQSMVNSMFAADPAIGDMLREQAYVQRKDYIASFNGDPGLAETQYFEKVLKLATGNENIAINDTQELKDLKKQKESWDKVIKTKGLATVEDREKYIALTEKIKLAEQAAAVSQNGLLNQSFNKDATLEAKRQAVDNIVAAANFNSQADMLARYLAMKDAEVSVKPDQIFLAKLRGSINASLENLRQTNRKELEGLKHDNRMLEIDQRGKYQTPRGNAASPYPNLWGLTIPITGDSTRPSTEPVEEEDPDDSDGLNN